MSDAAARPSGTGDSGIIFVPGSAPSSRAGSSPRERGRWIYPPEPGGWQDFVLSEWELEAVGTSDRHLDHSETNIVVEGELHVECRGRTVVAKPGDVVTVAAGELGRYWAPVYARMFAIYGPSATGSPPQDVDQWEL